MNYYCLAYSVEIRKTDKIANFFNLSFCDDAEIDYDNVLHIVIQDTIFNIGVEKDAKIRMILEDSIICVYLEKSYMIISLSEWKVYFDFLTDNIKEIILKNDEMLIKKMNSEILLVQKSSGFPLEEITQK